MKYIFSLAATMLFAFSASASNVELVVESVDNGGVVEGNTYRVYAVLPSSQHSLHAIFADGEHMLNVSTTGSFYQNNLGGYSSLDINENIMDIDEALAFDSWVTVGAENNMNNNLWSVGIDYASFSAGDALEVVDGAWFVVPTDVRAATDANNMVLLMQITTDGTATGTLNFQGRDANGDTWRQYDVTFSSDDAKVFGCTDNEAANYSADANFDNGSCEFVTDNGPMAELFSLEDASWSVFPNPIFENHFNLQFNSELNLGKTNMILEIIDMAGKVVLSNEISTSEVVGGNRVIVKHSLAAGSYTLTVAHKDFSAGQNIIINK
jgi:hypothetical protein